VTAPTHAPAVPWRRLQTRVRHARRVLPRIAHQWSWPRAAIRLLRLALVLLLGITRLLWLPLRHREATVRAAHRGRLLRQLADQLLRTLHVHVQRAGSPTAESALYACNHLSWLDVLVLLVALPESALIAKREVGRWPLIGAIVRATDTVFVDRAITRRLPQTIAEITSLLRRGRSVVLFAEGTTSDGAPLLPFKSPLFESAMRADVAVVPVSLRATTGRHGPAVARHVCWLGDGSLLAHLPLVAGTRRIDYVVRVGEPQRLVLTPALAPTRFATTLPDADHRLRRSRSVVRRLLARRAHDVVQRQGGYAGLVDATDEQRARLTIEEILLQAQRELADAPALASEAIPAHP